ncbi:MAG TPA: enoyl-CoA hydratase [Myxococcota bacterium]|jgi:enoyl-CoA hydratase/carnithine racemase
MGDDVGNDIVRAVSGGIATITFNRPEKKNAFTHAMYEAAIKALEEAAADKSVRCVLLTGAGNAFTSGNDLYDFMNNPPSSSDSPVLRFLRTIIDYEKPIVAAVNGAAVGIGVTMLLHCDLVYASDDAKFTAPFVPLGLVPEGASSFLLPRIAGLAKANEILLLGEPFDAKFAVAAGVVARAMPGAELAAFARAKAERIAALPAASLRATKALLRGKLRDRVHGALNDEAAVFGPRLSSPEAVEAFTAFFEKRKPDFSQFD